MRDPSAQRLGGDLGFQFLTNLCEAIEAAASGALDLDPGALSYRGVPLAGAVQRELFITLANDERLRACFSAACTGKTTIEFAHERALERLVARELLGPGVRVRAVSPRSARSLVGHLRANLRRSRALPAPPAPSRGDTHRIALVLDHQKFLVFLEPVIAALGEERTAIVSASQRLDESLATRGLPRHSIADPRGAPPPAGRDLGRLLRERPYVAATFDQLARALAELAPACVVVAEGNSPYDELANRAAQRLGIPCVCVQHGWSPIVHTGFRNMSFARMSVWGEGFAELLMPWNPDQPFEVVGSPLFASAPPNGSLRQGRDWTVAFFQQAISPMISREGLGRLRELIERTAARLPEATILVREHPSMAGGENPWRPQPRSNIVFVPPGSHGLRDVLEAADVAASIYSTTLLEAAAIGKPVVALNITSMPRYNPDLEALGVGVEASDVDAALSTIERMLRDDTYRASFAEPLAHFRERFFEDGSASAPKRIADLIEDAADSAERDG